MSVFNPQGKPLSFTGATSAPTSVVPTSVHGFDCDTFRIVNESATIACVIGWGATDAIAKANAAAINESCCVVPPFGVIDVVAQPNSYFSGITPSSTALIFVQAGLLK